jgi:hypothetical protein
MIKNNNNFDSLSKNLLNDVRAVMEGKKSCSKDCKCEKCETEEKGEVKEAKKMKGEDPCWKGYEMVGTKKKGGKEVPNCVPEETEVKSEAYNKDAVDKAIKSSRQKIGGREAKMIHALLKGRNNQASKNAEDTKKTFPNVKHLTKDGHPDWKKHGMDEETEEVNEISQKLATDYFHAKQDKARKDFMRGKATSKTGVMLAKDKIEGRAKVPATNEEVEELDELSKKTLNSYVIKSLVPSSEKSISNLASRGGFEQGERGDKEPSAGEKEDKKSVRRSLGVLTAVRKLTKEETVVEAKKESPIAGTRKISAHQGENGHHAEIRYNPDYKEYQVHHYENGKHMGEGPVSYHDTKAEAKDTAEYELKNYRPKGGSLHQVKESINEEVDFAKVRKQFDRNEDRNEHSKNAVLIAKHAGTEVDHKEAKDILRKHNELGHLSGPLMARRSALYDKLKKTDNYKKIFPEENVKEELIGKQKNIDKNNNGKLDKQDFEMLRKSKWKSSSYKTADGKWASKDVKEETLEEKLNPSMGSAKYIDDFIKSKDPRFEGKTKKERIKMALGAYYSAKNEEVEQVDEAYGNKRDYKPHRISVNGKYVATTTWAKDAREAERRFLKQHPEHRDARITVVKES